MGYQGEHQGYPADVDSREREMDRLIDNPLSLSIATRGFYRYIPSLLCLLMLMVLVVRRNGNTDNLIITSSGVAN